MQRNPWVVLREETTFSCSYFDVRQDWVSHTGRPARAYHSIRAKHRGVCVLPLDHEGMVTLVGQYRYVLGRFTWELPGGGAPKDADPLEVARIAGISAAKRTAEWIPLCHPLPLTHIAVHPRVCKNGVEIRTEVSAAAQTGVEMEALVAAAAAALTVYDMCKALDKGIEIQELFLLEKTGGKSGDFRRQVKNRDSSKSRGGRVRSEKRK